MVLCQQSIFCEAGPAVASKHHPPPTTPSGHHQGTITYHTHVHQRGQIILGACKWFQWENCTRSHQGPTDKNPPRLETQPRPPESQLSAHTYARAHLTSASRPSRDRLEGWAGEDQAGRHGLVSIMRTSGSFRCCRRPNRPPFDLGREGRRSSQEASYPAWPLPLGQQQPYRPLDGLGASIPRARRHLAARYVGRRPLATWTAQCACSTACPSPQIQS
jgi:hypothetical protein